MPVLSRARYRRFHEELVAVEFDVVRIEKVGRDVDDIFVCDAGPYDLVIDGNIIELPHGEYLILDVPFYVTKGFFELDTRIGDVFGFT